ncbi:MAG TPA: hypothetical protein VLD19_02085, partial [Chitinophagaceae bacterium]|nr:hypothetical protein [Chitinophagaceae bacterium]
LITTKKGRNTGKPVINYSTSWATQEPANRLHSLDRNAFIQKVKDINWQTAYLAPDYLTPNPAFNLATKFDATQQAAYADGKTDFDWYGAATNQGYLMDHNLSISNSSEKTNFYVSGGFTKQKGFIINDRFARKSIRMNIETKALSWLTLGAQTFGTFNDYSGSSPDLRFVMLYSPLNTPNNAAGDIVLTPNASINNPFLSSAAIDYDHRNALSGNFYTIVNIPYVSGLSYRLNFGNNYYWNQRYNSNKYGAGFTGSVSKLNEADYDYTIDNIVNYTHTFSDVHDIDVTMVYGARKQQFENTTASATGYTNISLGYNSIEQGQIQKVSSDAWNEAYNYQTARLSYGYRKKYLLTGTFRRDGYSGFGASMKYGNFPSI